MRKPTPQTSEEGQRGQEAVATKASHQSAGVQSDGMHRRKAHEPREAERDGGGNRNGKPARDRPGRLGDGEARKSVEAG